jgi:hypothetical protein
LKMVLIVLTETLGPDILGYIIMPHTFKFFLFCNYINAFVQRRIKSS